MSNVYTDPTTGEWVGEYETRDDEGNVGRRTEWFTTEAAARRFSQTGQMGNGFVTREGHYLARPLLLPDVRS